MSDKKIPFKDMDSLQREKLSEGVVAGRGAQNRRLWDYVRDGIWHRPIEKNDFPKNELRERYRKPNIEKILIFADIS